LSLQARVTYINQHSLGYDGSLVDEEGFPSPHLDFGELTVYRNIKR